MDGGTVPPCMEFDFHCSVSPVFFSPDSRTVTVTVDYHITAKITCLASVQVGNVYTGRRTQILYADLQY